MDPASLFREPQRQIGASLMTVPAEGPALGLPSGLQGDVIFLAETPANSTSIQVSPCPSLRPLTAQACTPSTSGRKFGANVSMATMVSAIVIQGIELYDLESKMRSSSCCGKSNRLGVRSPALEATKLLSSRVTLASYPPLLGLSCPTCQMDTCVNVGEVG